MNEPAIPSADECILVTFALADESRSFVGALAKEPGRRVRSGFEHLAGFIGGRSVAILYTGVGESAQARARLAAFLERQQVRAVISAGFAGGLIPALRVGDLLLGENLSASALTLAAGPLLKSLPLQIGPLTTQPEVAQTAAAKAALAASTGAWAVDMESAWIAQVCATAGVPMLSLRAISDAVAQDFPVPAQILFDAKRQRPRYFALPAWLLAHPSRIAPFTRFVVALGPARQRLAEALHLLIANL